MIDSDNFDTHAALRPHTIIRTSAGKINHFHLLIDRNVTLPQIEQVFFNWQNWDNFKNYRPITRARAACDLSRTSYPKDTPLLQLSNLQLLNRFLSRHAVSINLLTALMLTATVLHPHYKLAQSGAKPAPA